MKKIIICCLLLGLWLLLSIEYFFGDNKNKYKDFILEVVLSSSMIIAILIIFAFAITSIK